MTEVTRTLEIDVVFSGDKPTPADAYDIDVQSAKIQLWNPIESRYTALTVALTKGQQGQLIDAFIEEVQEEMEND